MFFLSNEMSYYKICPVNPDFKLFYHHSFHCLADHEGTIDDLTIYSFYLFLCFETLSGHCWTTCLSILGCCACISIFTCLFYSLCTLLCKIVLAKPWWLWDVSKLFQFESLHSSFLLPIRKISWEIYSIWNRTLSFLDMFSALLLREIHKCCVKINVLMFAVFFFLFNPFSIRPAAINISS